MQTRTAGMFRVCVVVVPGNRTLGMVWCYGNPRNSRCWCPISTWSTLDVALFVILLKAAFGLLIPELCAGTAFAVARPHLSQLCSPWCRVLYFRLSRCPRSLETLLKPVPSPAISTARCRLAVPQWPGTMGSIASDLPAQTWRHLKS